MNEQPMIPPAPPVMPPTDPAPPTGPANLPLPTGLWGVVEALMRTPHLVRFQFAQAGAGRLIFMLAGLSILAVAAYGLVVGAFSGKDQLWAAPLKLAAGLSISCLICLPSLFIFACIGGSPARLREVAGLLAGLSLLMTLLLLGFAPVAWVFSQSTESVALMGAMHLLFGVIAVGFGLRFLLAGFAAWPQTALGGIYVWAIIFGLVLAQMSTSLRPLVGTAPTHLPKEKKFFLVHWMDTIEKSNEKPKPTGSTPPAYESAH
jgi:hypothetical protein